MVKEEWPAMHVVSDYYRFLVTHTNADLNSLRSPNHSGLYYKLHGAHRPVNMNKTTIKRRKRVPAATGPDGVQVSLKIGGSVMLSMDTI